MKEKHNSEFFLKEAFNSFKMPLDNNAFDAFKAELDKEEKRKNFIWWYYGKFLLGITMLLIAITAIIYLPEFQMDTKQSSKNNSDVNPVGDSYISEQQKSISSDYSSKENDLQQEESVETIEASDSQLLRTSDKKEISRNELNRNAPSKTLSHIGYNKNTTPDNNVYDRLGKDFYQNDSQSIGLDQPSSLFKNKDEGLLENRKINLLNNVESISGLKQLLSRETKKFNLDGKNNFDYPTHSHEEKYNSHFYFNAGIGMSQEDNIEVSDPIFEAVNSREFLWYASAAYQHSENTAFELSLLRKTVTVGFRLPGFFFLEKVGTKVSLIRARMTNKIWSPKHNISFRMTNGIAALRSSSSFNDGFDFSLTVSGMGDPFDLSNVNFDPNPTYSGNHFMYSGGLIMDYKLSDNIDLNIGADYTLGFKTLLNGVLTYVQGEGVPIEIQTSNNLSFGSITLGLTYRLRKN